VLPQVPHTHGQRVPAATFALDLGKARSCRHVCRTSRRSEWLPTSWLLCTGSTVYPPEMKQSRCGQPCTNSSGGCTQEMARIDSRIACKSRGRSCPQAGPVSSLRSLAERFRSDGLDCKGSAAALNSDCFDWIEEDKRGTTLATTKSCWTGTRRPRRTLMQVVCTTCSFANPPGPEIPWR